MIAPPIINKDYYSIEFGFVTPKSVKSYYYNAFVTAALFQDSLEQPDKLHAGGLGFKAGIMLPTQTYIPLLITMTGGFAKTALHKNPFFGREEQSVSRKSMLLAELGLLYRYDKYFLRFAYQVSTVKYFKRHSLIMFGVNY